jgi:hypothetical protein
VSGALGYHLQTLTFLLDSCERESRERNLKPLHMVTSLSMQGELAAALRETFRGFGYRGQGELKLARVADWPAMLARLPLFDAGFGVEVGDDEVRATLRRNIGLALEESLGPDSKVWSLASSDSTGVGLTPAGGLSLYFVFESKQARLLLDVCWDS